MGKIGMAVIAGAIILSLVPLSAAVEETSIDDMSVGQRDATQAGTGKLGILVISHGIILDEVNDWAAPALDIEAIDVEAIKEAVEELDEHAHELIEITMAVHDNTEEIADDESLKDDLRAMAEEIHVSSHELGHIAEHIHEHVEELEPLAADPEANKAEIKEALDEIVEYLGEYAGVLEAKHDLVHKVLFKTPDSHKEYADATHDAVHEAEGIVEHMVEHAQELAGLVGVSIKEYLAAEPPEVEP